MEERFSLADGQGWLEVREEGPRARFQARLCGGAGLYKVHLEGPEGSALLGTLIPEGGALCLRRIVSLSELRRRGAWPPCGAWVEPVYPPEEGGGVPEGWVREGAPARLLGEPLLARAAGEARGVLLRRRPEGFQLAVPYRPDRAFSLTPLFCFARIERLGERDYAVFCFDRCGCPRLSHKEETEGEH